MTTASIETYFWMVDRLQIEDDSRNKVNKTKNSVTLSKDLITKIQNGYYVGLLLKNMYQTFENRTGKSFQIPSQLTEIDPKSKDIFNEGLWKIIFETLAQFGVTLPENKQNQILKQIDQEGEGLIQIFDCLYEIDNSPTGSISNGLIRKLELKGFHLNNKKLKAPNQRLFSPRTRINSAIKESIDSAELLNVQGLRNHRKNSVRGEPPINKLIPLSESDQVSEKQLSPLKRSKLLQSQPQYDITKQEENNELGQEIGNLQHGLSESKRIQQTIENNNDRFDEIVPKTLDSCHTSIQFILMSISISFSLKPKQANELLQNNNKYLIYLCIRGAKGQDFESVKKWYNLIFPYSGYLINLINTEMINYYQFGSVQPQIGRKIDFVKQNKGNFLSRTLNALKSGFYSRSPDVQTTCGLLFIQLIKEINKIQSNIVGEAWDWLIKSSLIPEYQRSIRGLKSQQMGSHLLQIGNKINSPRKNSNQTSNSSQGANSDDLEQTFYQTGLQAIIYSYQTNNDFCQFAIQLLLQFGKINSIELFTQYLQQQSNNWYLYSSICNDIFTFTQNNEQQLAFEVLEQSGVLQYWIMNSLKIADSNLEVPLNDRIISLVFLTEIWLGKPKYVNKNITSGPDLILKILKKASRDVRRTLCIISIELMFRLLEKFANERHSFAPTLLKTLTFLLVEFYWEIDVRELMLKHFIELYQNFQSIPISILCEPLLKQIEISQYHAASFNIFDFEFFEVIASHQKLTISSAVLLIDSLIKISLASVIFHQPSTKIIQSLMQRFSTQEELLQNWNDSIRQIMQTLINIEAKFAIHFHHLNNDDNQINKNILKNKKNKKPQIDPLGGRMGDAEFLQVKLNEKLIVSLLLNVLKCENQTLNSEMKNQLIDTHIAIKKNLNIQCKAIEFLLKFFTNKVDSLIDQRLKSNPQAANQISIPFIQELQQVTQDQKTRSPHNLTKLDVNSPKRSILRKMTSQQSISPQQKQRLSSPSAQLVSELVPLSASVELELDNKPKDFTMSNELYDYMRWEADWEIKLYQQFIKRNNRIYRELHRIYSNINLAKKSIAVDRVYFADVEKLNDQISASNLVKLIRDFQLDNGLMLQYLKQDVNKLVKQINLFVIKGNGNVKDLSFDGFVNFLLQYSYRLFGAEKENKAYKLIERLFATMKEQPQFSKLGLQIAQNEQNNQNQLEDQHIKDSQLDYTQDNKIADARKNNTEYLIPKSVLLKESLHVSVEILDEILHEALGIHFLEPISLEKGSKKSQPKFFGIIETKPRIKIHQGRIENLPLSQNIFISQDYELQKQKFEKIMELNGKAQDTANNKKTDQQKFIESQQKQDFQRRHFHAQALNKRAASFGAIIQQQVIKASDDDKQNMYECAEVLFEILKAVEKGQRTLRVDFTPYRLIDHGRKKKLNRPSTPEILDSVNEEDEAEKQRKIQLQKIYIERHVKENKELTEKVRKEKSEIKLKINQEKEIKQKIRQEYQQVAEQLNEEATKKREQLAQKKREKEAKKEAMLEALKQKKIENEAKLLSIHESYIEKQADKAQFKLQTIAQKEEKEIKKSKVFKDLALQMHHENFEELNKKKEQAKSNYLEWIQTPPIQDLINKKYKKGLFIKFEQCQALGKSTTGVSQAAWLEFLKQYNITKKIEPKALVHIHNAQVKEMKEIEDYKIYFKPDLKEPKLVGERELNYGAFVSALIKIVNIQHYIEQQKEKVFSKIVYPDFCEYETVDKNGTALEELFKSIEVAEKKVEKPITHKPVEISPLFKNKDIEELQSYQQKKYPFWKPQLKDNDA